MIAGAGEAAATELYLRAYRATAARRTAIIAAALCAVAVTFTLDILTGPAELTLRQVFSAIASPAASDATTHVIVWTLRLPMALMALVVGVALGAAGAEVQTILDNPIADPYTLGLVSLGRPRRRCDHSVRRVDTDRPGLCVDGRGVRLQPHRRVCDHGRGPGAKRRSRRWC